MEPGTLELQIFVSLIVILGTAFVALVCDYLKGNNEQLREHNLELRVRKEEQDRNKPQEAVEWLQHLMGATQRNPVRLASIRPQARQPHGAAGPRIGVRPAAAAAPQTVAVAQPQPAPASASVAEAATTPMAARVAEERPIATPAAPATVSEPALSNAGRNNAEEERPRASRLAVGRARRSANEVPVAPSLLDSLPVPAWLRKEQDEKAAARAYREGQGQPVVAEAPTAAAPLAGSTPESGAEHDQDRAWTYRGLLDRVVAATGSGRDGREVHAESQVHEIHLMEAVGGRQSGHIVSTVAVDVPSQPEEIQTSKTLETHDEPTVTTVLKGWAARIREEEPGAMEVTAAELPREPERSVEKIPQPVDASPIAEPVFPELRLPAGFHHRSVLTSCLQSNDFLTGVVVAIGINDYSHHTEKMGMHTMQELMRSVESMLNGLLREGVDFGCRSAEDEFILVFPNETGPQAQRRLTTISERLWNFQLRSLSSFSVLFSWGAVEVQGETLADAAASASERMYQTKRNRKTVSMDAQRRKLAVNL